MNVTTQQEMSTTNKPDSVLLELLSALVPRPVVAPEGWLRIAFTLALGLLAGRAVKWARESSLAGFFRTLGKGFFGLSLFTAFTYRDPAREPLGNAENYFYAPVDGTVLKVEQLADEPLFINGPAYKIVMTSHPLDVPMLRVPLPGLVRYIHHSFNSHEPVKLGLTMANGQHYLLTCQPNPYARLKLPFPLADAQPVFLRATAGRQLGVVEQIGVRAFNVPLMTTLYLPVKGIDILCRSGQHVQAGMTIVGRIKPA